MRARCGRMNSPLVLNTRSTGAKVAGEQKNFSNFAWYYASLVVYAVLDDFRGLQLPRTRTRTRTWKLVLEDPRGQGLSSRTTTLQHTSFHCHLELWTVYPKIRSAHICPMCQCRLVKICTVLRDNRANNVRNIKLTSCKLQHLQLVANHRVPSNRWLNAALMTGITDMAPTSLTIIAVVTGIKPNGQHVCRRTYG